MRIESSEEDREEICKKRKTFYYILECNKLTATRGISSASVIMPIREFR